MMGCLKVKSDSGKALQEMISQMETVTRMKTKRLRTNNASELESCNFENWIRQKGIVHEPSPPYSPETDGKSERVQ